MGKKRHIKLMPLDLHGLKHAEVSIKLENYIFEADRIGKLPALIITGNSPKMKSIVVNFLKEHNYRYEMGFEGNPHRILILK